jgi:hypothetical protein
MKNTRFSLQTNALNLNEPVSVTLMCHFKLEGVKNTNIMLEFTALDDDAFNTIIDDKDRFKSMCKVFGVSQELVKRFMDTSLMIAITNGEDVVIEHESVEWLRHSDAIKELRK